MTDAEFEKFDIQEYLVSMSHGLEATVADIGPDITKIVSDAECAEALATMGERYLCDVWRYSLASSLNVCLQALYIMEGMQRSQLNPVWEEALGIITVAHFNWGLGEDHTERVYLGASRKVKEAVKDSERRLDMLFGQLPEADLVQAKHGHATASNIVSSIMVYVQKDADIKRVIKLLRMSYARVAVLDNYIKHRQAKA